MSDDLTDGELEEFLRVARTAVAAADPSPPEVTELAKLAFQFRSIETADFASTEGELAGVRSAADGVQLQASKDGIAVVWEIDRGLLTGVVHGPTGVALQLQTASSASDVALDTADGSFEVVDPSEPYRLIVRTGDVEWVTPWSIS